MPRPQEDALAEALSQVSPEPTPLIVLVGEEDGHLTFSVPEPEKNPGICCDPGGNIHVTLEERPGFQQKILFLLTDAKMQWVKVCARRTLVCVQQGPIPGTPISVKLLPDPSAAYLCELTDEYSGKDSLGTFEYQVHYRDSQGKIRPFDPKIHNQGDSSSEWELRRRREVREARARRYLEKGRRALSRVLRRPAG